MAHVTACQIQRELNTEVLDGYTDMFAIVCTNSIRYHYNKIISLIKGIYKNMINIQNRASDKGGTGGGLCVIIKKNDAIKNENE